LGNTASLGRHEGELKIITDRGRVTRAEVETYYRSGIRTLISDTVDEEFNKVSFSLDVPGKGSYNTILTRNPQNGHYALSYERASVANSNKILSAASLEALSSAMSRSGDFVPTAIDTVRAQTALIPAVAYTSSTLKDVVDMITAFYLNTSQSNFNALGVKFRTFNLSEGSKGRVAADSLYQVIYTFNPALADKMLVN
jgi:hypothetical protein